VVAEFANQDPDTFLTLTVAVAMATRIVAVIARLLRQEPPSLDGGLSFRLKLRKPVLLATSLPFAAPQL